MSDVRFTKEQQLAIDTTDKSILVSAAAGSGKTAVLVERIINIILQGEADVDEMLVVTFTNAAASEMRLKLAKAIRKHMKEHPETRAKLREQLSKLYRAYISTFNSFAIRVIREFFYEIDMEPGFKVCDEIKSALLQKDAVDELFDIGFGDDSFIEGCSFREFLRLYSSDRDEAAIKESLINSYAKLRSMPDYYSWAYSKAELLKADKDAFLNSPIGSEMMGFLREIVNEACDYAFEMERLFDSAGLIDMFRKPGKTTQSLEAEKLSLFAFKEIFDNGGTPCDILQGLAAIHFDRMPTAAKADKPAYETISDEVKALRDHYKKSITGWKTAYLVPDLDTRIEEMNATYRYTVYYLRLIEKFEELYASAKRAEGLMDFSDMEHTAAAILSKPEIADILRKRFKFIFIDEYQDTNNIQEHLISTFARPDNVFKVGDVKQSIYKFRQAEPAIFERVRSDYKRDDNQDALSIDLNRNFRSNSKTLDYINEVFFKVMDGYDDDASLKPGLDYGENDRYNFEPEVHLLLDSGPAEIAGPAADDAPVPASEADDELRDLSKEEAEAAYVARLAEGIIGTTFYDSKAGVVRKAEARDITILLRAVRVRGEIYSRALRDRQIDSHIEEEADYFDATETRIAVSLLQVIDNMKKDVPLIATLHSEIFGLTPEELGTIRAEHTAYRMSDEAAKGDKHYYQSAEWYELNGGDEDLRDKLHQAMTKIRTWRETSSMMPLDTFIWKVLVESEYYMYAGAMYGGSRRQANLRSLVDRAARFTENNIGSLSDFITYLEMMQTRKIKTGQSQIAGKDDNLVQISTIHKSKGLEYPFVIVAGMGTKLRKDNNAKDFVFDSSLGIGLPYVDPSLKFWRSSILQRVITEHARVEGYKEELRVLYVAMTRARNKLYLVGTTRNPDKLDSRFAGQDDYMSIISESLSTPYNRLFKVDLDRQDAATYRTRVETILKTRKSSSDSTEVSSLLEETDVRLGYEYPDQDVLKRRSKYSVSAIRKEILSEEAASHVDSESEDTSGIAASESSEEIYALWQAMNNQKKHASKADIGIVYHRIMEYIDFGSAVSEYGDINTEYIEDAADYLLEAGAIDADAYKSVDIKRIEAFFKTDLGKRAAAASRAGLLKKEKPFTLRMKYQGNPVLVQGVIDCCFEENGKMILIDYKSSFIKKGMPRDAAFGIIKHDYKPQILIYSKAIEEGTGLEVSESYLYLFLADTAIPIV